LTIKQINPLADREWDEFVGAHAKGSYFQLSRWMQALNETYGFAFNCAVQSDGTRFIAALPFMETRNFFGRRRGVSLPFSDFCEPLADSEEDFRALLSECMAVAKERGWRYLELRGGEDFLKNEEAFESILTHDIDLDRSESDILRSFRDSTRRNISKAQKEGVSTVHDTSLDGVRRFYRLHCLTRREHGLPPQPWSFFRNLWRLTIDKGEGFVTLAMHEGKPVSANLYLLHGSKALYKYGASDKSRQQLRPSNLTMWEGIRKCRERGCTTLNLGRTEAHHTGLLQFKRGLGCLERTLRYYRFDVKTGRFIAGSGDTGAGLAARVFSRLPVSCLKIIGGLSYRYAG
jgi:lipid II:glycine glycyltransferase (peptidoglycan interpeptide bridge formation enzyme)